MPLPKPKISPNPSAKSSKPTSAKPGPVWAGPEGEGPNGGITFSLLSRFLTCRERFRVKTIEGLRPVEQFSHLIEYGNMWHACEEALAKAGCQICNGSGMPRGVSGYRCPGCDWEAALVSYRNTLQKRYPLQQQQVVHWWNVCRVQFPEYVKFWAAHPDVKDRTPLLSEQVFDVPYRLPSGRTVRLRGKWDSVDMVGKGKTAAVWIQENKTKGEVDEESLRRQLTFDLQTMIYVVALKQYKDSGEMAPAFGKGTAAGSMTAPIVGVRYNVVRRPLSGGKGSIVQKKGSEGAKCPKCKGTGNGPIDLPDGYPSNCPKCMGNCRIGRTPPETDAEFYARLGGVIAEDPASFFVRFAVSLTSADVQRFRETCLDPLLEAVCNWYEFVTTGACRDNFTGIHWRHPFGASNTIDEYGHGDLDHYLNTGSTVGLERVTTLFPELQT